MTISLLTLPVEIWLMCWKYCSPRQLRRLITVCRLFHALCHSPLLSAQLRHRNTDVGALVDGIDQDNWTNRLQRMHRMTLRLDMLSASRASQVRSWTVHFDRPLGQQPAMVASMLRLSGSVYRSAGSESSQFQHETAFNALRERLVATFVRTLGMYHNLTSLDAGVLTIDVSIRAALRSLLQLEELTLDGCIVEPPDGALLTVQRFTLRWPPRIVGPQSEVLGLFGSGVQLVHPASLRHLTLQDWVQTTLFLNRWGTCLFPVLQHLELPRCVDLTQLLGILSRCPRLESLVVPSVHGRANVSLPQAAVPFLRTLTAPLALIHLFTPGRPIDSVTVFQSIAGCPHLSAEKVTDLVKHISRSTADIQFLALPATTSPSDTIKLVASFFPALVELVLDVHDRGVPRPSAMFRYRQPKPPRPGSRVPEFNDETAFDDPAPEELSDSEEDEGETTLNSSRAEEAVLSYTHVLTSISTSGALASLPAGFKALYIRPPHNIHECRTHMFTRVESELSRSVNDLTVGLGDTAIRVRGGTSGWLEGCVVVEAEVCVIKIPHSTAIAVTMEVQIAMEANSHVLARLEPVSLGLLRGKNWYLASLLQYSAGPSLRLGWWSINDRDCWRKLRKLPSQISLTAPIPAAGEENSLKAKG
ncbi:hypothetical protein FB45DRAFT_873922 [Roridomyces roridus]|uniref:F-box domain-containing protein n=1 Tax=Roridomyces roridus TaxID=1738132 RepID=A0AAD7FBR5_9AGAR|nr:hypothetical protein FB45DRAFT_873922 [Roridomyces roridus]